tara:strand:- start:273 stop:449 length:177 start_codon:yes stop_codon:yes gene_type:complete
MRDLFHYLQILSIERPDVVDVIIDEDGEIEIEIDYDYFLDNISNIFNFGLGNEDEEEA